jgi:aspartyl/asparaginyl beta-hydroxylase (cupin superfamily)
MYWDAKDFPFIKLFEEHWQTILDEFKALPKRTFLPYPDQRFYAHGWTVYGLYAHPYPGYSGWPLKTLLWWNRRRCPKTVALLQNVPHCGLAAFSVLAPGAKMFPHRHEDPEHICHLGLMIPEVSGIEVDGEKRRWQEGKAFAFYEGAEHCAWNESDEERVIFLFDFIP